MRPYGPKGAWICYPCMTATPEREAEAARQFNAQLKAAGDASSTRTVMIGTPAGPVPINSQERLQ